MAKNIITNNAISELITKIKTALNEKISNDDLPYTVNKEEQTVTFKDDYAYVNANIFQGASIETSDGVFQAYYAEDGMTWVQSNVFSTADMGDGSSLLTDLEGYNYYGGFEEEGSNLNVLIATSDGDTTTYSLGTLKVAAPTHDHDAATKAYVDGQVISVSFSDLSANTDVYGFYYYSQQAFADAHSISPYSPIETFYDWESNGLVARDEVISAYNKLAYSKLDSDGNLTIYSTSTEDLSDTLAGIYLAFKVNGSISTS